MRWDRHSLAAGIIGRLVRATGAVILAVPFTSCAVREAPTLVTVPGGYTVIDSKQRQAVAEIVGEDLEGHPVSTANFAGQTIVINLWASWCAPCRLEAPYLEAAFREVQTANVQFLGVNVQDDRGKARAFEDGFKLNYPSIFDPSGAIGMSLRKQLTGLLPTTFVLDAKGMIASVINGSVTEQELVATIRYIVGESSAVGSSPSPVKSMSLAGQW
ncbi:TlpA family protein disulfide reductase [Micromonospora chokoriensis]